MHFEQEFNFPDIFLCVESNQIACKQKITSKGAGMQAESVLFCVNDLEGCQNDLLYFWWKPALPVKMENRSRLPHGLSCVPFIRLGLVQGVSDL